MTTDRYALLDAARAFLRLLREADDATFDLAYQTLAAEANGSDYAERLEPRQGLCVAMQAEVARRTYDIA